MSNGQLTWQAPFSLRDLPGFAWRTGFHIRAHGKLVNPEDDLFGITQRSHAYWRRFLARVEIPGLDEVLLVQRNAVSENSEKAQLARQVLKTLFNFTRNLAEERAEAQEFAPRTLGSKLKGVAPLLLPLALQGGRRRGITARRRGRARHRLFFPWRGRFGVTIRRRDKYDSDQ